MKQTPERIYTVRHARTNCIVGEYKAGLPNGLFTCGASPLYYRIPVLPTLEEILRVPRIPDGSSSLENGGIRAATLIIDGKKSRNTIWVGNASEMVGLPGYTPF